MLYGTTPAFLELFGLKSLQELPTLKEFAELTDDSKRKYEEKMGEGAPVGLSDFGLQSETDELASFERRYPVIGHDAQHAELIIQIDTAYESGIEHGGRLLGMPPPGRATSLLERAGQVSARSHGHSLALLNRPEAEWSELWGFAGLLKQPVAAQWQLGGGCSACSSMRWPVRQEHSFAVAAHSCHGIWSWAERGRRVWLYRHSSIRAHWRIGGIRTTGRIRSDALEAHGSNLAITVIWQTMSPT